jgi:hypothetical protein
MTLVLGDTIAVLDIFLPAFHVSHDVDEGGEPGHVVDESTTDTSTLVLGDIMATLDISLTAGEIFHDDNEGGEPKHVIDDSTADTPMTLVLVTSWQHLVSSRSSRGNIPRRR